MDPADPATPPAPPPTPARGVHPRFLLLLIWTGFLFSLGLYSLVAATIADNRRESGLLPASPPGAFAAGTGPFALLPYLLPALLLVVGIAVFRAMARHGTAPPGGEGDDAAAAGEARVWGRLQSAFITLLAIFETNALVGLVGFFLGGTIVRFFLFAGGTFVLFCVALALLMAVWPREEGVRPVRGA